MSNAEHLSADWLEGSQPELSRSLEHSLSYHIPTCSTMDQKTATDCVHGRAPWKAPLFTCVLGDSQSRHLNNAMARYIDHDRNTTDSSEKRWGFGGTDFSTEASHHVNHIPDEWGTCLTSKKCILPHINQIERCSTLLINFGQWPASKELGGPGRHAFTVSQYGNAVEKALTTAKQVYPNKRLLWLTIHAHSDNAQQRSHPPTDWRYDVVLRQFNQAAIRACKSTGVDYIDVFEVMNAVNDITYDGQHYGHAVERGLAKLVFNEICTLPV
jgi:hypothetical protein